MKHNNDHTGKSDAASVDGEHNESLAEPAHDEIAERAHVLWELRGYPDGTADQNWFEAAEQLRAKLISRSTRNATPASGSVQH
jgi:hypothetical protein